MRVPIAVSHHAAGNPTAPGFGSSGTRVRRRRAQPHQKEHREIDRSLDSFSDRSRCASGFIAGTRPGGLARVAAQAKANRARVSRPGDAVTVNPVLSVMGKLSRRWWAWTMLLMIVLFQAEPVAAAGRPKVMVVIEEKVAGVFGTTGWEVVGAAESAMSSTLLAAGFDLVDAQTIKRNMARDKALKLIDGDEKAAALSGLQFGAQIVITGYAISKNAGARLLGTNMQSLQATVQARAVNSDDGRLLAASTAQSSKAHIDEVQGGTLAIREAAEQVAQSLIAALLQSVPAARAAAPQSANAASDVSGSVSHAAPGGQIASPTADREVQLVIAGLVSYRHLSFVQRHLTQMRGVRGVTLRQFASGTAELSVEVAVGIEAIADSLAHQAFTGFRLEPTSVTPNRLDLRAVLSR